MDTLDNIQQKHTTAMQNSMESFGMALGALRYYSRVFPIAMAQIMEQGCKHCTQKKCDGCKDYSHWFWDGAVDG